MKKNIRRKEFYIFVLFIIFACFSVACNRNETSTSFSLQIPEIIDIPREESSITALEPSPGDACQDEIPAGCSVFTIAKGDRVFFGGNDDYIHPDSYYWVDPGREGRYGVIWVGTRDNVQQGVNENGLAYDANGLPRVEVNPHLERERVGGDYTNYPVRIMHECATVEEVIEWVNTHQRYPYMHDQMQFADATGDAVIINAGEDGEIVFTRKPKGDGYLVSTNFNVANPSNGYGYPCWRYDTASELLQNLVNHDDNLTYQDATNVLDAIHVEDGTSWTIESMVADLPNGIVYLYYFHQFDKPVELTVADELANPRIGGPLSKLFPEDVQQEAARRYEQIQARRDRYEGIGKIWLGFVVASVCILVIFSIKHPRGLIYWIPTVGLLGPLGLLVWLVAGRKHGTAKWQQILIESAGDVLPSIVAFMMVIVGVIVNMGVPALINLLLFLISPLLIGWLFFQSLVLSFARGKGYWRTLIQRIPHTWVASNLGMAGIVAVATPLVNKSLQLPLPVWTVFSWWAFTILGGLVGVLILFVYNAWCTRRGHQAWTVLAFREGDISSASWRQAWWWILLSYMVLFVGIATFIAIQQSSL
jgi:hypothetical protein